MLDKTNHSALIYKLIVKGLGIGNGTYPVYSSSLTRSFNFANVFGIYQFALYLKVYLNI